MAEPYIAEIRLFAGNFAPQGWSFCNGQTLPIADYTALFSLIGTTYGGDGVSTFALPNLLSRVPVHQGTGSTGTRYSPGQTGGAESVTLLTSQIPNHTHTATALPVAATTSTPTANLPAAGAGIEFYAAQAPNTAMSPSAIAQAGGSQPHNNIQPYQALSFIIALVGIYPSQN